MLQMRFSKEGMNSYMIVPVESEFGAGYQSNLFQYHSVPYFLQYEIREINGKQAVYYRLTYHITVKSVIGYLPFTLKRLKNMVTSIIGVMETVDEYLLEADAILWKTDKVFLDAETGRMQFCYYPAEGENYGSIKDFLIEIIQAVDKKEEEAVLFILQFYNLITEPDCTLESLQKFRKSSIQEENAEDNKDNGSDKKDRISLEDVTYCGDDVEEEKYIKDEKHSMGEQLVKGMLIAGAVISLILLAGLLFQFFSYEYLRFLFVSLGGMIVLTIIYMQMTKEESADTIMQDFFENQAIYIDSADKNPDNQIGNIVLKGNEKEGNDDFKEEMQETAVYGETSVLMGGKLEEDQNRIVSEERAGELYLKSMEKDKYPSIHVRDNSIVLGCMAECCNYVLPARGVSRMHAKLMEKADGVYLLDLNSTNGTYLNGERIESGKDYKLEEGDMVAFAMSEFYVAVER